MAAAGPKTRQDTHQGPDQHAEETVDQVERLQGDLKTIEHILNDIHRFCFSHSSESAENPSNPPGNMH